MIEYDQVDRAKKVDRISRPSAYVLKVVTESICVRKAGHVVKAQVGQEFDEVESDNFRNRCENWLGYCWDVDIVGWEVDNYLN